MPLSSWHLFKDSGDPWGPVTACVTAKIGERVTSTTWSGYSAQYVGGVAIAVLREPPAAP